MKNSLVKSFFRPLTFLLLCVFLVACKSSLITELAARSGEKLFWDDFTDQSGNWPQLSDSYGSMGYTNGAYHIAIQKAGYELWAFSGHAYGDVRVEANAARVAGPVQNLFGVICRARDNDNYYFFVISSDSYYAIGKIKNNHLSLVGQKMMSYSPDIVPGNGPNHLRFDCVGQTLTGYVNGQAVAITNDTDFSDGDAGLLVGSLDTAGVDISFDKFMVTKP
jgi:hypothetical protein